MKKRVITIVLALCVLLSVLGATAFADTVAQVGKRIAQEATEVLNLPEVTDVPDAGDEITVASIAVSSNTHKTAYKIKDALDVTNLTIVPTMSDGNDGEAVSVTADMVSGFDSSKAAEKQTLTITYEGKMTTYDISIANAVESIAVSSNTHKTAYKIKDALDVTNLTIVPTMLDGTEGDAVSVTADMVSGFDSSKAAEKQTLTITYEGKMTTYDISIANAVESIAVSSNTHKTAYQIKDALDVTNLTIVPTMLDGTEGDAVSVTAAMVSGFDSSKAAEKQTLTITYEGKTTTYDISIENAVESIKVNSESHKKIYKIKDAYDVKNLTVKVTMLDGTYFTQKVTADMVTGFDSSAATEKQTLTVSYLDNTSTTYDISVVNDVESIQVNSDTHKTVYKIKDALDVTNLTLDVTMLDGTNHTEKVTAAMVSGFDSSAATEKQTLTISYLNNSKTTYDIRIVNDVESIQVNSDTHKTVYKIKDALDVTNLTVKVTMLDGTYFTEKVTAAMVSGFDSSKAAEKQTLTVTYREQFTATYDIRVRNAPTAIAVNSTGHKLVYKTGDTLSVTGLTIRAEMLDGTTPTVPVTEDMVTGFDSAVSTPKQTLTITYDGQTTTYDICVESIIIANGTCGNQVTWTLDNEGLLILSGSGDMKDYYNMSFAPWNSRRANIKKVVINSGVTTIGDYAFYHCNALQSISIPDSVTRIGMFALNDCTALEELSIPVTVTSIGRDAFAKTPWLAAQGAYPVVNGILLKYQGDAADAEIPAGVTGICEWAFYECTELQSVRMPAALKTIGEYAFENCTALESVTIPAGVTTIGDYAFYGCTNLSEVVYNAKAVSSFGNDVFYQAGDNAGSLSVTVGEGVESIPNRFFNNNTALTGLTIAKDVKTIGNYAFNGCTGIREISFDAKSLTSFGTEVFTGVGTDAGSLKVTIGNNAAAIPAKMFYNNDVLSTLTIGENVASIGSSAFYDCDQLTAVAIPDGVTAIGSSAFSSCTALKTLTMGSSVETIGSSAFYDCVALTGVLIPDSATSIGDNAFWSCSALEVAKIGNGVMTVGKNAFWNCSAMKRLTIGKSVTAIGDNAFYGAEALTEINYNAKAAMTVGANIFDGAGKSGSGITVHFGSSVKKIPAGIFEASASGTPHVEKLIFEGYAPAIGNNAFIRLTAMAYYPYGDSTWTDSVRKNYGGELTWVPSSVAEVVSATCTCDKLTYVVGEKLDTGSMRVTITRADGCVENYDYATDLLELGAYDMSKSGPQTITVTCKGVNTTLQIYVCQVETKTMPAQDYPESAHNYDNDTDKTYTYQVPNARTLRVTFSQQTMVELNVDYIFVNGSRYTGNDLAGKTVTVSGDTMTIRLVSDRDETCYGFSIDKIEADVIVMPAVSRIELVSNANKTVYRQGEALDVTGLKIRAVRANGTEETVSVTPSMITGFDTTNVVASQTLTIHYEGQTTTYAIRVDSAIRKGDLNEDDLINKDDAVYLLNYTLCPERYPLNQTVDFNGDGTVTDADAIYLNNYAKNPDSYPLH